VAKFNPFDFEIPRVALWRTLLAAAILTAAVLVSVWLLGDTG
jgi:hypothetical protein